MWFMIASDTPTLGLLLGLPLAALFTGLFLIIAWLAFGAHRRAMRRGSRASDSRIVGWCMVICAVILVIITGIAEWPWRYDYHYWREINGRVSAVSNRLVSGGNGIVNQRFVLVINGQPYGVDDTRAALVKPGDRVSIRCKKEYVWGSDAHGWACNWNGRSQ